MQKQQIFVTNYDINQVKCTDMFPLYYNKNLYTGIKNAYLWIKK